MEQHLRTLIHLLIICLPLISINSLCKGEVCKNGIQAAFQRVANPRFVILVSGSKFWEFDRFKGQLVQKRIPLSKYWKGAPSNPGFVIAIKKDTFSYRILFYKDYTLYYFNCNQTMDRCLHLTTIKMNDRIVSINVNYTYEAGFHYHKGMPTPKDSIINKPFWVHVFARENLDEFDCHTRSTIKNTIVKRLCERNKVDKQLFPNFYKLKTEKDLVLAAEAFFNQTTNVTDFLVVVDRSIRYTLNGRVKSQSIDVLFKCKSSYFWVTSIGVVLFIQIAFVTILLAVVVTRTKSRSASA